MCVTINETHESFFPLAFTAAALSLSIVGAKVTRFFFFHLSHAVAANSRFEVDSSKQQRRLGVEPC